MASTASTILRLELMANGENDGTWGTKVNTNLGILESALTGTTSIATTGGTTTLTNVDYVNDQAKKLCLDVTGALVSNATIVIPNAAKSYKVFNRTTGAYTLSIKTSSGSAIEITQSTAAEVYCDGSNVVRFISPMTNFTTGAPATASGAAASSISVTPIGDLTSTNVQAALAELQADIDATEADLLANYIGDLLKTKGNIPIGNGSAWAALGVGTDGYALIAKSGATNGVQWSALTPAGTVCLFYQAAAPTGWTVSNADTDKALRVVSGTSGLGGAAGGTTAFTSVFSDRTIAVENLPSHTHAVGSIATESGGDHTHFIFRSGVGFGSVSSGNYAASIGTPGNADNYVILASGSTPNAGISSTGGAHTHSMSGTTATAGSGTAMNFAVQYCSVIKASKDAY